MTKNENKKESRILDMGGNKIEKKEDQVKPGELNFIPHPNVIFARIVDETRTPSGIIIPNQDKTPSPIAEILATGENVEIFKEGDFVYVDSSYIRFAQIDNVKGVILMQDGIFGKAVKK